MGHLPIKDTLTFNGVIFPHPGEFKPVKRHLSEILKGKYFQNSLKSRLNSPGSFIHFL